MNDLMPLEYEGKPIRVIRGEDGEPGFVAVDVCRVLSIANARDALARLDDDEKTTVVITDGLIEQGLSDNAPGTSLNLVNESGLYSLILTSRKPEAKAFKRWVTHEVLPSIRKTGAYTTGSVFTANIAKIDLLRESNGFLKELAVAQRTYLQLYRGMRLKGPQLILAVQNAFRVNFGIDMAQIVPLLDTPNSDGSYAAVVGDRLVTPTTYLGKTLNLRNPGKSANDLLEQAGLMVRDANGEPCPTEQGKPLGDWIETGKKHHSGAPIMAWRWKECATLEQLRQHQQGVA